MSYLVLALKWRPQRFADVAGQGPVSRTLSNALKTGRTAQAYLFTGPRGVGKTSMARILAKALNCETGPAEEPCNTCVACREITSGRAMDVIEIDGASNRGIDDIRELRESVRYAPSSLRTKVYIIDEVHMLTQDAFNALLKTLEEPPRHVVFVMATTEPLKVPQTILSRCQRFDFARLGARDAAERLRYICEEEGIGYDEEGLLVIGRKGEGSMRDALTLMDQVIATGADPITAQSVREALGIAGRELFFEWSEAILRQDPAAALRSLSGAVEGGANLQELAEELLTHLRNLLLVATDPSLVDLLEATEEERAGYLQQAGEMSAADLLRHCRLTLEAAGQMRRSAFPRTHLEVALAEMCSLPTALDLRRFIDAARGRLGEEPAGTSRPDAPSPEPGSSGGLLPRGDSDRGRGGAASKARNPRGRISGETPAAGRGSAPPSAPRGDSRPTGEAGSTGPVSFGERRRVEPGPTLAADESTGASPTPPDPPEPPVSGSPAVSWTAVLGRLASSKPALAAVLRGSQARLEDRTLQVEVPTLGEFHRQQLDRGPNRQFLLGLVEETYGRALGLRFSPGGVAGPETASSIPTPPESRGERADAASPDRIRRIADLFGGDVIGPA